MEGKRQHDDDAKETEEEEEEEWIGPMPTEAAKPKKRKGTSSGKL